MSTSELVSYPRVPMLKHRLTAGRDRKASERRGIFIFTIGGSQVTGISILRPETTSSRSISGLWCRLRRFTMATPKLLLSRRRRTLSRRFIFHSRKTVSQTHSKFVKLGLYQPSKIGRLSPQRSVRSMIELEPAVPITDFCRGSTTSS